jgi:hypothetical protein
MKHMKDPTPSELAEMKANYPYFRDFVYAVLRERFRQTVGELPDVDLDVLVQQQGAQPLEAFIDEIERPLKV